MSTPLLKADPAFVSDARSGLTSEPKAIPPRWLYDERGSELFERITELPEYYPTRTERAIFEASAGGIIDACPTPVELVELGAGSATKTRLLLRAAIHRQGDTTYRPVDISEAAVSMAQSQLERAFPRRLEVRPLVGSYRQGLEALDPGGPIHRLLLFIGSSIGNFPLGEQQDLLSSVAAGLGPDDRFLLGTDMVKDVDVLEAAYDDAQGVTAQFSKNLLARMNRELGGDFDLDTFRHRAHWDADQLRIRIHLESLTDQMVHLSGLDLLVPFDEGELLHVEDSYKYTPGRIDRLAEAAGLARQRSWYDQRRWFGVHLLRRR